MKVKIKSIKIKHFAASNFFDNVLVNILYNNNNNEGKNIYLKNLFLPSISHLWVTYCNRQETLTQFHIKVNKFKMIYSKVPRNNSTI